MVVLGLVQRAVDVLLTLIAFDMLLAVVVVMKWRY